jgi:phage terminase large subunit
MYTCSEMAKGNLFICEECKNTIRQIESYVWDSKAAQRGEDEPVKKEDDCPDALRYAVYTHKVSVYDPYQDKKRQGEWFNDRYRPTRNI